MRRMNGRIDHANLVVRDIDAMIRFLTTAFPQFRIRADVTEKDGGRWVHVGTDESYIAVNGSTKQPPFRWTPYQGFPGVNHLGFETDDADALRERMIAAGYRESTVPNNHPFRKRVYFYDAEGNDWEFVEYLSDKPEERNDYSR